MVKKVLRKNIELLASSYTPPKDDLYMDRPHSTCGSCGRQNVTVLATICQECRQRRDVCHLCVGAPCNCQQRNSIAYQPPEYQHRNKVKIITMEGDIPIEL